MCKALKIIAWIGVILSALYFVPVVLRIFLSDPRPTAEQLEKAGKVIRYHGAKELTCDWDMTKCWFERNGKRVKVKL